MNGEPDERNRELLDAIRASARIDREEPPAAGDIIALAEARKRERLRARRGRILGAAPWAIAAAAPVLLAVQLTRGVTEKPPTSRSVDVAGIAPTEIVTGSDELATVRMADGTVARLAPRTRLRLVSTGAHERVVSVQGHAFFAVARDPQRPFRVRTSAGELVALGTRFDVRSDNHELRLAVLEGRVALIAGQSQTEVGTGEAAGVRDGVPIPIVKLQSAEEVTRWMRRFLAFQNTPLFTVAAEMSRVYGRRITITDPAIGAETVTGTFTDESLEQVVHVVCTVVGVNCVVTDSQITISR